MRVHLLVDVALGDGHEERPVKEIRQELVDHIERLTLWVGGLLPGEAQDASAYDVVSFDVVTP